MTLHDRDRGVVNPEVNLNTGPPQSTLGPVYDGYSQQYTIPTSSASSPSSLLMKNLAEKYTKLLAILRGGNHPFVEAFRNDLHLLYGLNLESEQVGWNTQ